MDAKQRSLGETILRSFKLAHERLLKAGDELSPEEFARSAGPNVHSVAWHLWHAARWDDVFASYFHKSLAKDPRQQVWEREALAEKWALVTGSMGLRDTGTKMTDEAAEEMRFPEQKEVLSYARQAFGYTEEAIGLMPDAELLATPKVDPEGATKLDNVLIYHEHLSRHLGAIESIRGIQQPPMRKIRSE
jgi:uncharacterized damage-inducible protein DinB